MLTERIPSRLVELSAWVVLALLTAAFGAKFIGWPLNRDITAYATIARELLNGSDLYVDMWDLKPPGIFAVYMLAQWLIETKWLQIYLIDLVPTLVVLASLLRSARAAGFSTYAGFWSAALWVALSGNTVLQTQEPNTEVFINACSALAFLLLLRPNEHASPRAFAIGLLFAGACLFKSVAIAIAAAVGVTHAIAALPGMPHTTRFRQLAIMAAAGTLGLAAVVAYFAATGRFDAYREAMIDSGFGYAGDLIGNLLNGVLLAPLFGGVTPVGVLFALVPWVAIAVIAWLDRERRRAWILLAAYAFGSLVAVALPGQFYAHYFQLLLPPLCLGFGWVVGALRDVRMSAVCAATPFAALAVLATLGIVQLDTYRASPEEAVAGKYQEIYLRTERLARRLGGALGADGVLYQWGEESGLYWHSGLRPPASVLTYPLLAGPQAARLTSMSLQALQARPPDVIVGANYLLRQGEGHPIVEWIRGNYVALLPHDAAESAYFTFFLPMNATPELVARVIGAADEPSDPVRAP